MRRLRTSTLAGGWLLVLLLTVQHIHVTIQHDHNHDDHNKQQLDHHDLVHHANKVLNEFSDDEGIINEHHDHHHQHNNQTENVDPENVDLKNVDHLVDEVDETSLDPETRKKRQISRQQFDQYVNNMNNPNYDPRAEEGEGRQLMKL